MDIDGLSEATLEQFIARGWLQDFTDIYRLDNHRDEIVRMDGFGERSWQRLWDAIQKSRNTTFERYLIAMDIPMIGNTASAALGRCFDQSLRAFEVAVDSGFMILRSFPISEKRCITTFTNGFQLKKTAFYGRN